MTRSDLHLHTIYSRGSLPPVEVVAAITDHDVVDDVPNVFHDTTERGRPSNGLTNQDLNLPRTQSRQRPTPAVRVSLRFWLTDVLTGSDDVYLVIGKVAHRDASSGIRRSLPVEGEIEAVKSVPFTTFKEGWLVSTGIVSCGVRRKPSGRLQQKQFPQAVFQFQPVAHGETSPDLCFEVLGSVVRVIFPLIRHKHPKHFIVSTDEFQDKRRVQTPQPINEQRQRDVCCNAHVMDQSEAEHQVGTLPFVECRTFTTCPTLPRREV